MALVKKSNLKRTLLLLGLLGLIVVGGGLTLYYVNRPASPSVGLDVTRRDLSIPASFDLSPIAAARTRGLKTFGDVSTPADAQGGNSTPFQQSL